MTSSATAPDTPPRTGSLEVFPLPNLLYRLYCDECTGILRVDHASFHHSVDLYQGRPTNVNLVGESVEPLGRILLELGKIDDAIYQSSLLKVAETKRMHGEILREMGAVTLHDVEHGLQIQLRRKLNRLFRLAKGTFQFEPREQVIQAVSPLDPLSLIFDGVRSAFDEERLEGLLLPLVGLEVRLREGIAERAGELELSDAERAFLEKMSEFRPFADLADGTLLPSFEARVLLACLLFTEALDVRDEVAAWKDSQRPRTAKEEDAEAKMGGPRVARGGGQGYFPTARERYWGRPLRAPNHSASARASPSVAASVPSAPLAEEPARWAVSEPPSARDAGRATAEAPRAEARASEARASAPRAEARASEARASAPQAEARASAPQAEARAAEARASAPRAEARASEARASAPQAEARASAPRAEARGSETRTADASRAETPRWEAPRGRVAPEARPEGPSSEAPRVRPAPARPPPRATAQGRSRAAAGPAGRPAPSPVRRPGKGTREREESRSSENLEELLREKERQLESGDFFDLLEVSRGATSEEVKHSYFRLAKRFHPDRFFSGDLKALRRRAEAIFERLSEAYETLRSDDQRAQYLALLDDERVHGDRRRAQIVSQADEQFRRAEETIAAGDLGRAEELLRRAIDLFAEDANYHAALGWVTYKNPQIAGPARFSAAMKHLLKALELKADCDRAHLYLGRIYESEGRRDEALRHYQKVPERSPRHAEAAGAVARLRQAGKGDES